MKRSEFIDGLRLAINIAINNYDAALHLDNMDIVMYYIEKEAGMLPPGKVFMPANSSDYIVGVHPCWIDCEWDSETENKTE